MSERWHYTYLIHNEVSGKYYIGVRSSTVVPELDERYQGSSKYLQAERDAHPFGWSKFVLNTFSTREEANRGEEEAIDGHLGNGLCLNVAKGGNAWISFVMPEEARRKISAGNRGKPKSPEHRKAISEAGRTAKPHSPESRKRAGAKSALKLKGRPLSEAHRAAVSAGQRGKKRVFTESHKRTLRDAAARKRADREAAV